MNSISIRVDQLEMRVAELEAISTKNETATRENKKRKTELAATRQKDLEDVLDCSFWFLCAIIIVCFAFSALIGILLPDSAY